MNITNWKPKHLNAYVTLYFHVYAGIVRVGSLEELLAQSDCVSLHCGLGNRHLFSDRVIRLMRPGAYLVNVSNSDLVDETALVAALREGRLRGAALDSFQQDPFAPPGAALMPSGTAKIHNIIHVYTRTSVTVCTRCRYHLSCRPFSRSNKLTNLSIAMRSIVDFIVWEYWVASEQQNSFTLRLVIDLVFHYQSKE